MVSFCVLSVAPTAVEVLVGLTERRCCGCLGRLKWGGGEWEFINGIKKQLGNPPNAVDKVDRRRAGAQGSRSPPPPLDVQRPAGLYGPYGDGTWPFGLSRPSPSLYLHRRDAGVLLPYHPDDLTRQPRRRWSQTTRGHWNVVGSRAAALGKPHSGSSSSARAAWHPGEHRRGVQ